MLSCVIVSLPERCDRLRRSIASRRARAIAAGWTAALALVALTGCRNVPITHLERVVEARRLSADMLVQFTRTVDAGNRAVMADTDDTSAAFVREAEEATNAVSKDSLAVENTNLKAQRLSFGPVQEAADAFRDSLQAVVPAARTEQAWHVQSLVATAVADLREIQVLQAPHIAESDEAAMTRLEKRAAGSEASARRSLETLAGLLKPAARPQLAIAAAALDRFTALNTQLIALSRRNSNVRSLSLSLGQKRTLTAACEESLRALQHALAQRGFTGTR